MLYIIYIAVAIQAFQFFIFIYSLLYNFKMTSVLLTSISHRYCPLTQAVTRMNTCLYSCVSLRAHAMKSAQPYGH